MNPRFSCSNHPPLQSSCCRQFWRKSALCAHRHDPSACRWYKGQPLRLSASCHRYGGLCGNEDVCPVRPVPPISVNASVGLCDGSENTEDSGSLRSGSHDNALAGSGSDMGLEFFCITTYTKRRPPLTDMSFQHKFVTSPTRNPQ